MADENSQSAEATQVDANTQQPQEGNPEHAQDGGGNEQTLSAEDARKLRSESRALRTRLKEAENRVQEFEKTTLTDTERRERELKDAHDQLEKTRIQVRALRVETAARKLGFIDPDDASALINWDSVDDPENPKHVEKALRDLRERKPHLVLNHNGDASVGRGTGASGALDMNQLIRRAAGRN